MLQLHFTVEYKKPEEQQHGNECRVQAGAFIHLPSQQCDATPLQTTAGAIGMKHGTEQAGQLVLFNPPDDICIDR